MKSAALLTAWLLLASSASAQARDTRPVLTDPPPAAVPAQGAQAPAPMPPPDIVRMAHPDDGRPGYWLDDAAYSDALAALSLEAGYLEQLALLNRRLALRATEANELRLALGAMTRARDEIRSVVRTAESARRDALDDMRALRRWTWVLAGIAFAAGVGVTLLLAFAVDGAE